MRPGSGVSPIGRWRLAAVVLASAVVLLSAGGRALAACPDDCDSDGFTYPTDCNDRAPNVYPGAPELCNGIDNDCDGIPDDSPSCSQSCTFPDSRPPATNPKFGISTRTPVVAWDGNAYIAAWTENTPALRSVRLNSNGQPLTVPRLLSQVRGRYVHHLAASGTTFGLAWFAETASGTQNLTFTPLDADAQRAGADVSLATCVQALGSYIDCFSPRMAWSGSRYGILWARREQSLQYNDTDLMLTLVSESGGRLAPDVPVTSRIPIPQHHADWDLVWNGSEFVIAFIDEEAGARVAVQRVSESGALIGGVLHVSPPVLDPSLPDTPWGAGAPRLLRTGDRLLLAYSATSDALWASYHRLFLSFLDLGGVPMIGPVPVTETPEGAEGAAVSGSPFPSLAWTGSEVAVVWRSYRESMGTDRASLARFDLELAPLGRRVLSLRWSGAPDPTLIWNGSRYLSLWGGIESTVVTCDCATDADGDGASSCTDCDDADPTRAPVLAICDGLDNDCYSNGTWPESGGWEENDLDGDGVSACAGDCAGWIPDIHPGFSPLPFTMCQMGFDRDCDPPTWWNLVGSDFRDDDYDGASDCQADCDDTNSAVLWLHPQTCGDGINNDCLDPFWPSLVGTGEIDEDGDGLTGCVEGDNCSTVANPGQEDGDGDGVGDACDTCPALAAASQRDFDGDGQGDLCDIDDGHILIAVSADGSFSWQEDTTFVTSNVYRGDVDFFSSSWQSKLDPVRGFVAVRVPQSGWAQAPGSNPIATRFCGLTTDSLSDPFVPVTGKVAFYLVTGVTAGSGEAGAGTWQDGSTDTGPRLIENACP